MYQSQGHALTADLSFMFEKSDMAKERRDGEKAVEGGNQGDRVSVVKWRIYEAMNNEIYDGLDCPS